MVGDSLQTDILPARGVGLNVAHIADKVSLRARWPTIPSIEKLTDIVQ
jgi:FMN phosphatase YigB (HAD superfamily)